LRLEKLGIVDTEGQMPFVYHAEPESPFGQVLERLAALESMPAMDDGGVIAIGSDLHVHWVPTRMVISFR